MGVIVRGRERRGAHARRRDTGGHRGQHERSSQGLPRLCLAFLFLLVSHSIAQEVQVTELPAAFQHAQDDRDMQLLYETCLAPDLAVHAGKSYSLADIAATAEAQSQVKYFKHLSLAVVKDGAMTVATLNPSGIPPSPTPRRVAMMREAVLNGTRQGVVLPDSVFILSTWDEPRCPVKTPSRCPAPVLSLVKSWMPHTNTSDHTDILVPFFNHVYQEVIEFPWALKMRKALMRAAMQNGMPPSNTRLALVKLSQSPEGHTLLDAGITHNLKVGLSVDIVPKVSIPDHAKWRYLISADGFTASCRLGKLLGTNSVVIKEATRWVEHYYRALTPGGEYVPFTRHNALQVLKSVDSMSEEQLQTIARNAQTFQQRYLSQHAKVLYLRQVVTRYNTLFASVNMTQFVHSLNETRLTELGYLMEQLREYRQTTAGAVAA